MDFENIKSVATKHKLLTVDLSWNEILVLRREVPLSCYGRLQVEIDKDNVIGHLYNYSLPSSASR